MDNNLAPLAALEHRFYDLCPQRLVKDHFPAFVVKACTAIAERRRDTRIVGMNDQ
jgi:hypothetical protein